MTTSTGPSAAAAARARLADIFSILAEDRAARHEGRITLSSARPVPADPPPAVLRPVNHHPGPDFAPEAAA